MEGWSKEGLLKLMLSSYEAVAVAASNASTGIVYSIFVEQSSQMPAAYPSLRHWQLSYMNFLPLKGIHVRLPQLNVAPC